MAPLESDIFIPDGYTLTRTIPGVAGLHPDLVAMYRPALALARIAYRNKGQSNDPAVLDAHECELVAKYTVSLNGRDLRSKEEISRLKPAIRQYLVDLILGYLPADEAKDAGNSHSG